MKSRDNRDAVHLGWANRLHVYGEGKPRINTASYGKDPGLYLTTSAASATGRVWAAPADLASPQQPEVAELPLGSELPALGVLTLGPQEANSPQGQALQSSSTEALGGDTINILEVAVPV